MFKFDLYTAKLCLLVSLLLLSSCSSDKETNVDHTFSVDFSTEAFEVEAGKSFDIALQISKTGEFDVNFELSKEPESGAVSVTDELTLATYTAADTLGEGTFYLRFESDTMFVTHEIKYTVIESTDTNTDPDPTPDTPTTPTESTEEYDIRFPSDYQTIFEHESITFDIKRNYEQADHIVETFHFNTHNVKGKISKDKTQITLTAEEGNEDTYGEIIAVTNVDGVIHESKMYVIYFNKNRDLTTEEVPVIALLDTEITITPYSTIHKAFGVYDRDSDRISYRILSAPSYVATHINKVESGFDLTIYTIDEIDASDNELVLEVSDAHNKDVYTFNLVQAQTSAAHKVTQQVKQSPNTRPQIYIEENVAVSLIKKMDGTETGIVAELAFAYSDDDNDDIEISVSSSRDNYTFRIEEPYVYVMATDMSELEHDQITITASDGQFESKLTYHLYIPDNYLDFLGGNPNIAPFIDLPTTINLLETKTIEQFFNTEDFERHPFEIGVTYIDGESVASITDTILTITASSPEASFTTQVTVWLEDVFESRREHVIDVNIYKNTAPSLIVETNDIQFIEQQNTSLSVGVDDIDQPELQPTFSFDETKLILDYVDGILTVSSVDLEEDYAGEIQVYVQDEFGETDSDIISVYVRYISPDNAPPVIVLEQESFSILPGECNSTLVTITDDDNDPLVLNSASSNALVTYEWDQDTGIISFCVDISSDFEQEYAITLTAFDGINLTEKNVTLVVPRSPAAPILEILPYSDEVDENEILTINYRISDLNGGDMVMSMSNVSPDIIVEISTPVLLEDTNATADVFIYEGTITVTTPENVNTEQAYTFNVVARDDADLPSPGEISFTVVPVNNPPVLTIIEQLEDTEEDEFVLVITNDFESELNYIIEDADSSTHEIEVRIQDFREDVYDFSVNYVDQKLQLFGLSKRAVFDYVRGINESVSSGTESAEFDMEIRIEDDADFPAASYVTIPTKFRFENEKPVIDSDDKIVMKGTRPIQTSVSLSLSDPDGETVEILSVVNTSANIEIVNDLDSINTLNKVVVNGIATTDGEPTFITVVVSDGYESTAKQIYFEVID
jgi:hypothetical protein